MSYIPLRQRRQGREVHAQTITESDLPCQDLRYNRGERYNDVSTQFSRRASRPQGWEDWREGKIAGKTQGLPREWKTRRTASEKSGRLVPSRQQVFPLRFHSSRLQTLRAERCYHFRLRRAPVAWLPRPAADFASANDEGVERPFVPARSIAAFHGGAGPGPSETCCRPRAARASSPAITRIAREIRMVASIFRCISSPKISGRSRGVSEENRRPDFRGRDSRSARKATRGNSDRTCRFDCAGESAPGSPGK